MASTIAPKNIGRIRATRNNVGANVYLAKNVLAAMGLEFSSIVEFEATVDEGRLILEPAVIDEEEL